jgi:hypothetical protein
VDEWLSTGLGLLGCKTDEAIYEEIVTPILRAMIAATITETTVKTYRSGPMRREDELHHETGHSH